LTTFKPSAFDCSKFSDFPAADISFNVRLVPANSKALKVISSIVDDYIHRSTRKFALGDTYDRQKTA